MVQTLTQSCILISTSAPLNFTHHVPFLIFFSFSATAAASSSLSFVTWPQRLCSMGRSLGSDPITWSRPCPFMKCDIISASCAWLVVALLSLLARGMRPTFLHFKTKFECLVTLSATSSGSKMTFDSGWKQISFYATWNNFSGLCCVLRYI